MFPISPWGDEDAASPCKVPLVPTPWVLSAVVLCLIVAFEKDARRRLVTPFPSQPETFDTVKL